MLKSDKTFLVAGGDLRQVYLASALAKKYRVYTVGFKSSMVSDKNVTHFESTDNIDVKADYIVLPVPASPDGENISCPFGEEKIPLEKISELCRGNAVCFAGKAGRRLKEICEAAEISLCDYMEREELAVLNAVPTAEGALQIALEELPTTIFGQKVLVIGLGRIGKVLAMYLKALGADVTVAARSYSSLAWAQIYGCKPLRIAEMNEVIGKFGLIINTAPSMVIDRSALGRVSTDALIIDLASKPGGVDFEAARRLGRKTIWALSVPGKVAPVSAGEIIASTILNILEERGETNAGKT
ncbi:MAG: dipicolinate synthase subunit DpsA [Oscillospiraceae bacterium]